MNNFKNNKNKILALIALLSLILGNQSCCAQNTIISEASGNNQEIIDKLKNKGEKDDLSISKKNVDNQNNIKNNKMADNELTLKDVLKVVAAGVLSVLAITLQRSINKHNRLEHLTRGLGDFSKFDFDKYKEIGISLFRPNDFDNNYRYNFNENQILNRCEDRCWHLYHLVSEIADVDLPSDCWQLLDEFKAKRFVVEYLLKNIASKCNTIKNGKPCYYFKSNGNKFEVRFDNKVDSIEYRLMEIIVANHSKKETVGFKLEMKRDCQNK